MFVTVFVVGTGVGGVYTSTLTLRALMYPDRATPSAEITLCHEPMPKVNSTFAPAGNVRTTSPPGVERMVVLSMVVPFIIAPLTDN